MKQGIVLTLVAILVLAGLWVVNCSGPRPEVGDVRIVAPTTSGEPYELQAVVRNQGHGHGEVGITARLRDRTTGRTFQAERTVRLKAGESTLVVMSIKAPLGSYTPEVEVEYPPR
jgi:hypothetical protein